jgi:cytochrome P450
MDDISISKVSNLKLTSLMYRSNFDLLELLEKLTKNYGQNVKYGFGAFSGYLINDPEVVKYIQMENWQNFPKSRRYLTFSPLIGKSILVANGEEWKKRRQIAQPIFQQRDLLLRFNDILDVSTNELLEEIKIKEFNLFSSLSLHTFRVITRITFGDTIDEIFDEFHECILKLQKACIKRALSPLAIMDHLPLPSNVIFKKESKKVHKLLDNYIQDRIKHPNQAPKDLLDRYLIANKKDSHGFSLEDIRNELVTLIIAGNETSALTLFWCILEVLKAPLILEKIRSEVSNNTPTTFSDKDFSESCPYLDKVIHETLRKYPAVWAVSREVKENVKFKNIQFKKNEIIIISPYFFHRNPKFWPSPEVFNPERFSKKISDDIFIPFTRGPRFCIGKALALYEIRQTLFSIFKTYNLKIKNGSDCKPLGLINLYPSKEVILEHD